jgi:hypothetical protein
MGKAPNRTVVEQLVAVLSLALCGVVMPAAAQTTEEKIAELQKTVELLTGKLEAFEARQDAEANRFGAQEVADLSGRLADLQSGPAPNSNPVLDTFRFGGYGELHANFTEGKGSDLVDLHRLVLYLGCDFTDWIQFHSEWEVEHGYVSSGAGGELVIEQAYFDLLFSDLVNVRAGRVLTPLGITNKWHEPTLFNGVERPSFDKYAIPTTWSSDGIGIFGNLTEALSYEAYVVGGLDGSKFNALNGIRGGRIKESPSLHDPAVTGRIDYYPLTGAADSIQSLRLGLSGYFGALDNGNNGKNPGIHGDIAVYSADLQYSHGRFDLLGAFADTHVDGAKSIGNGTAAEMLGWYLEGAYHWLPDSWKTGRLAQSDAVVFLRYDDFDTQYKMPSGVARNPAGDRTEWTVGLAFWPTRSFVIKTDYQIPDDAAAGSLPHRVNFGVGFTF